MTDEPEAEDVIQTCGGPEGRARCHPRTIIAMLQTEELKTREDVRGLLAGSQSRPHEREGAAYSSID
jgi:hypothetical protein